MNPLVDLWLRGWDRLINQRYRWRPRQYPRELESESLRVINLLYRGLPGGAFRGYHHDPYLGLTIIVADILRSGKLYPHFRYRHFTKLKTDGSQRELVEPDPALKGIQRAILKYRLNDLVVHPAAMGFQRNKSIADHVWAHSGAEIIITADIQDFFPSTKAHRIFDWWRTHYDSEQAAQVLTLFTTYRGALPQGAPTSPALSNLVNHELDIALQQRARQVGGVYTRYGDDLVFSFHRPPPADFENGIRARLRAAGYELNARKGWRVYRRRDEPEITGVVLNRRGQVEIPRWMRDRMIELERSSNPLDADRLAGYRGFQAMVEKG